MDKYRIDSHKLMYHPQRVADWLDDRPIYPIHVEISLSNHCNHRCIFCCYDYKKYDFKFFESFKLYELLEEFKRLGVKSVMFAGDGEPLLHPEIYEIVKHAYHMALDVGIQTNGSVYFNPDMLKYLKWIKFSVDAAYSSTHRKLHRRNDFEDIVSNIKSYIKYKKRMKLNCTIGVQMLLLKDNLEEVDDFCNMFKDVDYIVLKPFSKHPEMLNEVNDIDEKDIAYLDDKYQYTDKIIVRYDTYKDIHTSCPYDECYGLNFICYIDAYGDVYPCNGFIGLRKYLYGNLYGSNSFEDIWMNRPVFKFNSKCRKGCRMDRLNRYLYRLKYPEEHDNFI